jgi:tetratricopeptide (TPR) repeat protein
MYKYFICYETKTGLSYAVHLKEALEKWDTKNNAFVAKDNIRSGKGWEEERDNALNECKYFIVVITVLSMFSTEVIKEYNTATGLNKRILPFRYSKIQVRDTRDFEKTQQIEFANPSELANEAILEITKIEKTEANGVKAENDPKEFIRRGTVLFNMQRYDEALKVYEKAIELSPNFADGWVAKGVVFGRLNRLQESIDSLNQAIKLNPNHAGAWATKTIRLYDIGKYPEALESSMKAIELNPTNPLDWAFQGIILYDLKKYSDALNAFDEAIKLDNRFAKAWSGKSLIYFTQQHYNEAITAFQKAIELDINSHLDWYGLSCSYALIGDKSNSLDWLSKVISIDISFKEKAREDKNFKSLWNDEDFKKITS